MKVTLLIIDPEKDFCCPTADLSNPNRTYYDGTKYTETYEGALYVGGAENDMMRLSKMIVNNSPKIDDIQVTLDSHRHLHIAHPIWWINLEDGGLVIQDSKRDL